MLYQLLKAYARLVFPLYCVELRINQPEVLDVKGPVLFAANHPNSFLDGMILTTLCNERLYSLARGDAFKGRFTNRLLRSLHLLPVYRTSEGVENLEYNYTTFSACIEAFRNNHLVLIFSEGRCENEWHLRPLKKGTARLAISAWQNGVPLTVIPTAFNYSSFKKYGKAIHLSFGTPINQHYIDWTGTDGQQNRQFNDWLQAQLQPMVYEIDPADTTTLHRFFPKQKGLYLLLLPLALAGGLVYAPLFLLCTALTKWGFAQSGHYDSVQTSLLLLAWPVYVILLSVLVGLYLPFPGWATPFLLYLLAWVTVRVKYSFGL